MIRERIMGKTCSLDITEWESNEISSLQFINRIK